MRVIFIVLGLLIISIGLPWLLTRPVIIDSFNFSQTGQIGDTIGGILNPVLAAITIVLLYITYDNQRAELSRSRELVISQKFESAFFNLLENQTHIVEQISFPLREVFCWLQTHPIDEKIYKNDIVSGINFFEIAANDWNIWYNQSGGVTQIDFHSRDIQSIYSAFLIEDPNASTPGMENALERIKFKYKIFYEIYHVYYGNYFRHLYYILKFIDDSGITNADKMLYAGILQSKLTSGELRMIFYNGLCFEKMKDLINKYQIIKNLAADDLADSEAHRNLFENIALRYRAELLAPQSPVEN